MSVDPYLAVTGQPYAFTADDPLNSSDPLGLRPTNQYGAGCGQTLKNCHETHKLENRESCYGARDPELGGYCVRHSYLSTLKPLSVWTAAKYLVKVELGAAAIAAAPEVAAGASAAVGSAASALGGISGTATAAALSSSPLLFRVAMSGAGLVNVLFGPVEGMTPSAQIGTQFIQDVAEGDPSELDQWQNLFNEMVDQDTPFPQTSGQEP